MNTESKTTGLDNLLSTLERVLTKFDEIDGKMSTLHEELDYVMEELVVSKAEIRQTCESIRNLETTHIQGGEELHEKVSTTFENLFSQMSQIVNAAREGLLDRNVGESQVEPEIPVETNIAVETDIAVEVPALEQLKTETEEPAIEADQLEPNFQPESELPTMEEVHETLKEVAKTLVGEEDQFASESVNAEEPVTEPVAEMEEQISETVAETNVEEEASTPSPLAELNNLLADTEKEVTQELLGTSENEVATETQTTPEIEALSEVPISSEPPELLKETLSQTGSFGEIETEDLGQEPEGPPTSEMNELLKSISSSYVAGQPE